MQRNPPTAPIGDEVAPPTALTWQHRKNPSPAAGRVNGFTLDGLGLGRPLGILRFWVQLGVRFVMMTTVPVLHRNVVSCEQRVLIYIYK